MNDVTMEDIKEWYDRVKQMQFFNEEALYVTREEYEALLRTRADPKRMDNFNSIIGRTDMLIGTPVVIDPVKRAEQRERWARDASK
jgi:hypothetical protein